MRANWQVEAMLARECSANFDRLKLTANVQLLPSIMAARLSDIFQQ